MTRGEEAWDLLWSGDGFFGEDVDARVFERAADTGVEQRGLFEVVAVEVLSVPDMVLLLAACRRLNDEMFGTLSVE